MMRVRRVRTRQSRQEIGQPTQIVVAEMGAARADDDGRIVGLDVRPLHRQTGELARIIVEVDAILAPRLPAIDQLKPTPVQWVERMCDAKGFSLTGPERCNRLLRPTESPSDSCAPSARNVSTGSWF
jgi:hypothetical protein